MKKTLLLLVAIALTSAKMMAEGLTATLQQGETMTAFYGVNAFVDAYNAAEDGAVITLSEGKFNDVTSIEKSITVIGNMAFDVEGYEKTYLANGSSVYIQANNVTLEGINFGYQLYIGGVSNCHIKRCYVYNLGYKSGTSHYNTLIDQCHIVNDFAINESYNYCIKNSIIDRFSASNYSNRIAYIANCYLRHFYLSGYSSYCQPCAIYKNNVLVLDNNNSSINYSFYLNTPSEFYNNYIYRVTYSDDYEECYVLYYWGNGVINQNNADSGNKSEAIPVFDNKFFTKSFDMLGDDGTPVGITGGSGFSPYPSIPRITSKQIDSKTDSEGKLNVKITVSTEETLVKEEKPEEENPEEGTTE